MSPELATIGPAVGGGAGVRVVAEEIIDRGLWCAVEVCVDVPDQRWEQRLVSCRIDAASVVEVVAEWIRTEPEHDARLIGCRRRDLRPDRTAPAALVHLAPPGATGGG